MKLSQENNKRINHKRFILLLIHTMIQIPAPIHTKAKPISSKAVPSCIAPSYPTYAFIFPFKNKKTIPAIKNKFATNVGVNT